MWKHFLSKSLVDVWNQLNAEEVNADMTGKYENLYDEYVKLRGGAPMTVMLRPHMSMQVV